MRLRPFLLVFGLFVLAACNPSASVGSPTTTTRPSTTTTIPALQVEVQEAPQGLREVITAFYAWTMKPAGPPPRSLPQGLVRHLRDLPGAEQLRVDGQASVASILPKGQVGVVTAGKDVVLAVEEGGGWRVVGAKLGRFGKRAWYGPSPRMILAIGSDARPGQDPPSSRSDSLHILTSVLPSGRGAIVGIPRDSWVEAPSGGSTKITNIMAAGGPEATLQTVGSLSGLPLEGYLLTGFAGFVDLVNDFGGIDVEIPFAMSDPSSGASFNPGEQYLHGWNALAFARNRHLPGGDFTRSLHQGIIIEAVLDKARSQGIAHLPAHLATLTTHATTNLGPEALLTLAAGAYELKPEAVENVVVPGSVGTVGSASVVFIGDGADQVFADLADGVLESQPEP
ncbi:MAG: LCP family protein [Actinomycetota bacterium]|nr:LCP family protein [Actinomycetota bacterium]